MSRTNSKAPVFAFTNYPIEGSPLGDVVKVEVLTYDRNKYALVRYQGHIDEVKAGYLMRDHRLDKPLSHLTLALLPYTLEGTRPSKQKAQQEVSRKRKLRKTYYCVIRNNNGAAENQGEFSNLRDALKAFKACGNDALLFRDSRQGYSYRSVPMMEMEDGFLTISVINARPVVKTRHLRKAGI